MNDVHVSKDNIQEFHVNWAEALSICEDRGIDDLIIGGDLWQSRSSQTLGTLLAVREALTKASRFEIVVSIMEGNHCKVDQESIFGYSHLFSQYPGVNVIDETDCYDYGNTSLYLMSYFPENGSFTEKLRSITDTLDASRFNILYAHEGISGALAVPATDELPAKIFRAFDRVLVGHYHNRCRIEGTNIEYIGSSRQHNFGEDEEKGYTVLYRDGSTEFIKNKVNRRYRVFEFSGRQPADGLTAEITALAQNPQYLIKTKINCKSEEATLIDRAKLLEMGVSKIDIITEDEVMERAKSSGLDVKFNKTGIKREYCGFCEQEEVMDVEFGLQYLNKIS